MKFTAEFEALFTPAPPEPGPATDTSPWKLLLVDDEPDIHAVMRLALGDVVILGRRLQLFSANSAAQAREHLHQHPDTALVLLDVVMETERAGLDLVNHVRQELGNPCLQLVLVTGQPGYAPLRDVAARYDIDGYRLKSELTADRLVAVVSRSLRTHRLLLELHEERERYRQQAVVLQERQAELEARQRQLEAAVRERTSALEQSMQRLVETQFAMDRVGLAIAWVDAQTQRLTHVNETACQQLGYTREELLKMSVRDLNPEADGLMGQGLFQALQTRDHFGPVETWHRRKDGSTCPAEVTVYRRNAPEGANYIIFFSDISTRQARAADSRARPE